MREGEAYLRDTMVHWSLMLSSHVSVHCFVAMTLFQSAPIFNMLDRCDWGRKGGAILTDLWPPSAYAHTQQVMFCCAFNGLCAWLFPFYQYPRYLCCCAFIILDWINASNIHLLVGSATSFACEYTFLWNIMGRNLCTGARASCLGLNCSVPAGIIETVRWFRI